MKPDPIKLKSAREAGNFSRMEIASVVSRGERTIYRWEDGTTSPSQLEIKTLARFYRCQPAALCKVSNG